MGNPVFVFKPKLAIIQSHIKFFCFLLKIIDIFKEITYNTCRDFPTFPIPQNGGVLDDCKYIY